MREKYPVVKLPPRSPLSKPSSRVFPDSSRSVPHKTFHHRRHLATLLVPSSTAAPIESVFLDPLVLSNRFWPKLPARRLRQQGVPGIRLSRDLYRDLTLATEPQGIGAVLGGRGWLSLEQLQPTRNSLWLAVESIESPGNLGTIIRTAEAAGVSGVFILNPNCDPFDPATIRATMGSLFSQKLVRCSVPEFKSWAKSNGVSVVASSPSGLMDYKGLAYRFPTALIVGSEKQGLSEQLLEAANFVVRIPMRGGCDSLNAAVATGVLLFEIAGQRSQHLA